jgi:hypothetical protein
LILSVQVAKNGIGPLRIPEISIKKAKQERCLTADAGKHYDWNIRFDPLHLRPHSTAGSIGQVVFQENAVYMQSCQEAQSLIHIGRGRDLVASSFQHVFQRAHVLRVILNAKDHHFVHSCRLLSVGASWCWRNALVWLLSRQLLTSDFTGNLSFPGLP